MMLPVLFPSMALVKRELLSELRRVRSFICLMFFLFLGIAAAFVYWPYMDSDAMSLSFVASRSEQLFNAISVAMLLGALGLLPGLSAANFTAERDQEMYDQLRLTLIRASGLVLANLANSLGFFLLLVVTALPVLSLVLFAVGIDSQQIIHSGVLVLYFAVSAAVIGILSGAFFRKTIPAILGAYGGFFLFWLGPGLLRYYGILWFPPNGFQSGQGVMNVLDTYIYVFNPHFREYMAFVLIDCILLSLILLRRTPKPAKVTKEKTITDQETLEARRRKFPYYLIDPLRRTDLIADDRNPLLAREIRSGLSTRAASFLRFFYGSALLFSAVNILLTWPGVFFGFRNEGDDLYFSVLLTTVLVMLAAIALVANVFTKEHELHNIDMLRLTLLSPRQIVLGKFFGGILAVLPVVLGASISLLPVLVIRTHFIQGMRLLLPAFPALLACLWTALCASFYASLWTRRTSFSFLVSCIMTFALLFWPFLSIIYLNLNSLDDKWLRDIPAISPPFGYLLYLNPRGRHLPEFYVYWPLGIVVYALTGLGLIGMSVVRFRDLHMREK